MCDCGIVVIVVLKVADDPLNCAKKCVIALSSGTIPHQVQIFLNTNNTGAT
jgi:hypothetical protein